MDRDDDWEILIGVRADQPLRSAYAEAIRIRYEGAWGRRYTATIPGRLGIAWPDCETGGWGHA